MNISGGLTNINNEPNQSPSVLMNVLDNYPHPSVLLSPDGHIIQFNSAFISFIGYTIPELEKVTSDRELTPESWWAEQNRILEELRTTKIPQRFEKEYMTKSGDIRAVEVLAYLMEIEGIPGYCLFINEKINPESLSARSISPTDNNFDAFDLLPDATFMIDLEGRVIRWNKAMVELTRIQAQDVIGRGDQDYSIHFYGFKRSMLIDQALMLGKELAKSPLAVKHNTNTLVVERFCPAIGDGGAFLWAKASPIYDENGEVAGAVESFRDVTQRKENEDTLRLKEERYRNILETIEDGCFEVDLAGNFTFFNNWVLRTVGCTEKELLGMNYREYMDDENAERVYTAFNRVFRTLESIEELDWQVIRKDGEKLYVEASISPILSSHGVVVGFRGIVRDITIRKEAEEALRQSENKYRLVFENSPLGILHFDKKGQITACNENLCKIFEASKDFMMGTNLLSMSDTKLVHAVKKALAGKIGIFEGEYTLPSSNKGIPLEAQFAPVMSETGIFLGGVGIVADVTERKEYEETIRHLAYHDALTGLPNRLLFYDRLSLALSHAQRNNESLSIMFLDLDNFKLINDTLGHSVGDRLLQEVSRRLTGLVRAGDTISRMGGDEFVFLFPGISQSQGALGLAKKIVESFTQPFEVDSTELRVSASIGISLYPTDGQDVATLMKNADAALYHAKEKGRNTYKLFAPEMNVSFLERLSFEKSLRDALIKQEFVLHYQPLVDVGSGKIVGLEALVRWNHPTEGLKLPGTFIFIAEETGIIIPLEKWVLRTACTQNKSWQDKGLTPQRIAVNISGHHFWQQDLQETVQEILEETQLNPRYLELEITESVAMQNPERAAKVLQGLRDLGVQIALDDFGTGYSSLSYLKNLPLDSLKIDRTFIRDLTDDNSNVAISQAVISLGKNLNLKVTAEGVEEPEQLAILKDLRCDKIQGFLFSRPLPADAIADMLREDKVHDMDQ
ncbi:MAG: EAL domain-containing protein [Acidobacteriota bacterium]